MSRTLRLIKPGAVIIAAAAVGAALLTAPASAATDARVVLKDEQPGWAHAQQAGTPSKAQRLNLTVYLGWRHTRSLNTFIRRVSTPGSGRYGAYLTTKQFRDRYAPTSTDVAKVRKFLTGYGLRAGDTPANRSYLEIRGTVAQAQKAFGTKLALFHHDGGLRRAPANTVTVPKTIAGLVAGVDGLSQNTARMKPLSTPPPKPPAGFRNARPCSKYFGQKKDRKDPKVPGFNGKQLSYVPCGYTPKQLQGAYGTSRLTRHGLNGRGSTVAVVDAFFSGTLYADAAKYAKRHGPAPLRRGQYKQRIHPPNVSQYPADKCDASGWIGEQSLDVEAVHAMAPGADILYVGARDCQDKNLAKAVNDVVDHHRADIVTNSYGTRGTELSDPPSVARYSHRVAQQAAATGISLLFSSGDEGDSSTTSKDHKPTVTNPENDPLVTSVGGTALGVTKHDHYGFETGWGTTEMSLKNGAWTPGYPGEFLYGSGGGTSRIWAQPWYQRRTVPASIAKRWGKPGRAVPDVAMVGDTNTGMLIGHTQTFSDGARYGEYRIGGTSLSSPLLAGQLALAVQANHGRGLGFVNPALYRLKGTRALHDIRGKRVGGVVRVDYANNEDGAKGYLTHVRTLNATQSIHVRRGYDDVTGVGTPRGARFIADMAALR